MSELNPIEKLKESIKDSFSVDSLKDMGKVTLVALGGVTAGYIAGDDPNLREQYASEKVDHYDTRARLNETKKKLERVSDQMALDQNRTSRLEERLFPYVKRDDYANINLAKVRRSIKRGVIAEYCHPTNDITKGSFFTEIKLYANDDPIDAKRGSRREIKVSYSPGDTEIQVPESKAPKQINIKSNIYGQFDGKLRKFRPYRSYLFNSVEEGFQLKFPSGIKLPKNIKNPGASYGKVQRDGSVTNLKVYRPRC